MRTPGLLPLGYCMLALLAALAGGVLPNLMRWTHTRLQLAVSFVGGLMLGLSLLGLSPHGVDALGSAHQAAAWLLCGFVAMFLLQHFLPFHHHDVGEESARSLGAAGCSGQPPGLSGEPLDGMSAQGVVSGRLGSWG